MSDADTLIKRFQEAGQSQVFRFYDTLDASSRRRLIEQARTIDLDEVSRLVQEHVLDNREAAFNLEGLEPAPYISLPHNGGSQAEWAEAFSAGAEAIRAGRVAAFTVAGGQGTRLGYDGPKGTYPVTPLTNKSLFQVFAEKIRRSGERFGVTIPWFILTSEINNAATIEAFEAGAYYGLPKESIYFVVQGLVPAVDLQGKILLSEKDTIAMTPDGHGGSLRALVRSGAVDAMRSLGVDSVSYFQVDNPIIQCIDPYFIGFHVLARSELSSKMVPKAYPLEKVGHFCVGEGVTKVIEYSDMPVAMQEERLTDGSLRFRAGSVAIHIFDREFIARVGGDSLESKLPFHRADKKIPYLDADGSVVTPETPNGVKFEMFVFDALPLAARPVIIEAARCDDFSPVKNADGVDSPKTCKEDQLRMFARWLRAAGVAIETDASGLPLITFEISHGFAADEKDFVAQWNTLKTKPVIQEGTLIIPRMNIIEKIELAAAEGKLLESTITNLKIWASADFLPEWVGASIEELLDQAAWEELNDRFYQDLAFGTGGMRGRTIGRVATSVETGLVGPKGTPEHAAVGTNVLNDFNLIKATIGLFRYCQQYLAESGRYDVPRWVIAHDVRHFSRHFCELAASTWSKLGGQAMIFDGPRSTPQLSFSVRHFKATCGAVITASHNPPHDNGFKVYFEDGAQIVAPHAEGIVGRVSQVTLAEVSAFLEVDLATVITLDASADHAYLSILDELVIDQEVMEKEAPRVVFSPIHGTGAISSIPTLRKFGVEVIEVTEQMEPDPRFPSVKSPNPENAEALALAMAKADEVGADVVIATDPDADRMGVAVRDTEGKLVLLTGNQIGTLLAEYRISTLKDAEILPEDGSENAVLIKTFVTSPMQESVAEWHGLKTINTLTGFKWIGEKLAGYEAKMKAELYENEGLAIDYDACDLWTRADLLLDYSTYFVFGGEESYGYLASDRVRDKDANAAVLMFCELAAYLKANQMTFTEYLDGLYLQHGYYDEKTINIYYEGAAGAEKIRNILDSYRENPPKVFGEVAVSGITDFGQDEIIDADGKKIPPQDFFFLELSNGYSFAVRGSGTEPKIKFYVFGRSEVTEPEELPAVKEAAAGIMQDMLKSIEADARKRAEG